MICFQIRFMQSRLFSKVFIQQRIASLGQTAAEHLSSALAFKHPSSFGFTAWKWASLDWSPRTQHLTGL